MVHRSGASARHLLRTLTLTSIRVRQYRSRRVMAGEVSKPHDHLFRSVFREESEAAGLLRAHLPDRGKTPMSQPAFPRSIGILQTSSGVKLLLRVDDRAHQ